MIQITKQGKVVSQSKNLRGILTYGARRDFFSRPCVKAVSITQRLDSSANLHIVWDDGAIVDAIFASFTVCKEWVLARRSWAGADLNIYTRREGALQLTAYSTLGKPYARQLLSR